MLSTINLDSLRTEGYVTLDCGDGALSTLELARRIGVVLDLHKIDPAYPVNVELLTPREKSPAQLNRYHGNFGFDEYPAHTDLAHWLTPPRYLLLKAIKGTTSVITYIHTTKTLSDFLPVRLVDRALFFPRSARTVTALPFRISRSQQLTVRCDSLFIRPANPEAMSCVEVLRSEPFLAKRESIVLSNPSDAVIIDNWRCLHGRSSVQVEGRNRIIERVYLESIYGTSG